MDQITITRKDFHERVTQHPEKFGLARELCFWSGEDNPVNSAALLAIGEALEDAEKALFGAED